MQQTNLSNEEVSQLRKLLVDIKSLNIPLKDFLTDHNHDGNNTQKIDENTFLYNKNVGGLRTQKHTGVVADDGEISLPDATSGWGFAMAGDSQEYSFFVWTTAGAVTLISNSANTVTTNTDAKFCIYDSGTQVKIKNRLGASKQVRYLINY